MVLESGPAEGGAMLLPWPGQLRGGSSGLAGRAQRLPLSGIGHEIHQGTREFWGPAVGAAGHGLTLSPPRDGTGLGTGTACQPEPRFQRGQKEKPLI